VFGRLRRFLATITWYGMKSILIGFDIGFYMRQAQPVSSAFVANKK